MKSAERADFFVSVSPTAVLLGLNLLMFAVTALSGISLWNPPGDALLRWGANFGPLTLEGQWWRLLTSMFLHVGIVHLALNMWGLWVLGRVGEYLYGNAKFIALYLLSGMGGSVASLARNPMTVSVGASGALFGIAGALIASSTLGARSSPLRLPRHAIRNLILVTAANLAFGFFYARIDNGAHIGGLLTGLLLGGVLALDARWLKRGGRMRPALFLFPAAGVVIAGCAVWVYSFRVPSIKLLLGTEALQRGDIASAVRELETAVALRPNDARAHEALGTAYALGGHLSPANKEYESALQLDVSSVLLRQKLAALKVAMGDPQSARQLLAEAAQRSPGDPQVLFQLGLLLQQMGEEQQAIPPLEKAASLEPKFPPVLEALGTSYLHLQQYERAIAVLQQAHKLVPSNPDVLMLLANAYEASGMRRQADEAYRQAYLLRHPPPN